MQSITVASYLSEKNDSSDQSLPNSETNNKAFDKFNLKMFCGLIDQLEELIKVATNTARTSDDIKVYFFHIFLLLYFLNFSFLVYISVLS